jgi:hypothetical protein
MAGYHLTQFISLNNKLNFDHAFLFNVTVHVRVINSCRSNCANICAVQIFWYMMEKPPAAHGYAIMLGVDFASDLTRRPLPVS